MRIRTRHQQSVFFNVLVLQLLLLLLLLLPLLQPLPFLFARLSFLLIPLLLALRHQETANVHAINTKKKF
jgi:hypothetical protein